jgi:hypothetical protein
MTMRVNEVMSIKIDGASISTVIKIKTCSAETVCSGVCGTFTSTASGGAGAVGRGGVGGVGA